ncbi:hypothetical protein DMH03_17725 [Amycolatopsis sp. WAC 01376]|uniref:hypothetical protein n=1 Tax=Amycolatopsis sp. WAC 01376 TaxID=2203195 RepID=UPI000F775B77|nr:hypothetical protein [Amycolatopsis sp. WAC 01376]RSM60588.1 hypothetical protein DMH03_17725 [Amycolatopsis sp. WAC 01376]
MPTNAAATGFWSAMPGGSRANNARQGRALLQGVYQNNDATPMNGTRSGVVPTTWDAANTRFADLLVTVTSGLTMSVAPGSAVAHRSGQGPYEGWLLAAASVTCDPAPASNPRNDLVVMRWYDSTQGDTSPDGNPCRIEIITGTPGAVPVDPITANSLGVYTSFPTTGGGIGIPLARAQVSTGGVITLTRLRRSVGVIGATRALMEGDSDTAGNVGDTRYNPATDTFEVRDSAGNWRKIRFGSDIGGEWRANAAQSLTNGGAVRLNFPTAVVAGNGITFNGTNTWTIGSDGVYSFFAQARKTVAAAQDAMHITGTTYSDSTLILPGSSVSGYGDVHVSGSVYLTAGTQVCAWYYSGSATANSYTTRYPMFKIWKQQAAA